MQGLAYTHRIPRGTITQGIPDTDRPEEVKKITMENSNGRTNETIVKGITRNIVFILPSLLVLYKLNNNPYEYSKSCHNTDKTISMTHFVKMPLYQPILFSSDLQ